MKPKTRITTQDYVHAMKKASRELEIELYGKQVSMRGSVKHKSKKAYNRMRDRQVVFD